MEAGALGTETSDVDTNVMVRGYFETRPDIVTLRAGLVDALRIYNLAPVSLIGITVCEIVNRDWLAEWKKDWQPVEVGRFIIAPPWSEPPLDRGPQAGSSRGMVAAGASFDSRITCFIDPGMAFGTGTHDPTRLSLKSIEEHFRGGSLLDGGTGT